LVVECEAVERGWSFGPFADPAVVGEGAEVAADGGLGELDDGGDFADGEFVSVEEVEETQANGVAGGGESGGKVGEDFLHPYFRMNGRMGSSRKATGFRGV
jgi:hypothetical protein